MAENTKEIAFNNLKEFNEICKELVLPFLLDGGTCLGAYRDKDFCEDDENDIDLTTFDEFKALIPALINKCEEKGFALYHYWNLEELATQQVSFKKHNLKIDLMFKKFKNDFVWWTIFKGNKIATYKKVPAIFYEKLQSINFKGIQFLIPHDIEEYLTYRYGDWKTPVHRSQYSCYKTDRCIVKGYEEI